MGDIWQFIDGWNVFNDMLVMLVRSSDHGSYEYVCVGGPYAGEHGFASIISGNDG